jgi:hypothetical protein
VRVLEAERREMLERLRSAEKVAVPPPRVSHPEPRSVESRVREWWRRVSR